jgi:hypothetical protein
MPSAERRKEAGRTAIITSIAIRPSTIHAPRIVQPFPRVTRQDSKKADLPVPHRQGGRCGETCREATGRAACIPAPGRYRAGPPATTASGAMAKPATTGIASHDGKPDIHANEQRDPDQSDKQQTPFISPDAQHQSLPRAYSGAGSPLRTSPRAGCPMASSEDRSRRGGHETCLPCPRHIAIEVSATRE